MQCLYHLIVKKDWQYQDHGVLDRTHLRFFTKKSLIRLIGKSGFEISSIEGINSVYQGVGFTRKILLFMPPLFSVIDNHSTELESTQQNAMNKPPTTNNIIYKYKCHLYRYIKYNNNKKIGYLIFNF